MIRLFFLSANHRLPGTDHWLVLGFRVSTLSLCLSLSLNSDQLMACSEGKIRGNSDELVRFPLPLKIEAFLLCLVPVFSLVIF